MAANWNPSRTSGQRERKCALPRARARLNSAAAPAEQSKHPTVLLRGALETMFVGLLCEINELRTRRITNDFRDRISISS